MSGSDADKVSARELLVHLSRSGIVPMYILAEVTDIMRKYPDEDDADDMMNAVNARLHQLMYSTTWGGALEEYEAALQDERGMWAGRYALFDDAGDAYVLRIMDDAVTLSAPDSTLTDHTFAGSVLRIADATYSFELTMQRALTAAQMDSPGFDIAAASTPTMQRCAGTVTITRDGKTGTARQVSGKRGCFSSAGVERKEDGDPPGEWTGTYDLCANDDPSFPPLADKLTVAESDGVVTVTLGQQAGSEIYLTKNVLHCKLGADGKQQLAGYFIRTEAGNQRRFFGLIDSGDKVQGVTGYWTRPQPVPALPIRMHAAAADGPPLSNDPPKGARKIDVKLSGLKRTDKKVGDVVTEQVWTNDVPILLPGGVERNSYWIVLNFTGAPPDFSGALQLKDWQFGERDDLTTTYMHLLHADADGQPWLDGDFGETESAGWYKFTIVQELAAVETAPKQPKRTVILSFTMQAMSRFPIVIEPEELPPVMIDIIYKAGLTATGGEPKSGDKDDTPGVKWSYTGDLPTPLTCNISKDAAAPTEEEPLISGTVTEAGLALQTFPVRFVAEASDRVMMQPGKRLINLRVEPQISSGDNKMVTSSWFNGFGSAAIGALLTGGVLLIAYAAHKYKANSRYEAAKTALGIADTMQIPRKEQIFKQVNDVYSANTDYEGAFDDAVTKIQDIRKDLKTAITERTTKRDAAQHALDEGGLSADRRRELEGELRRLEDEIVEARARDENARRVEDRLSADQRDTHRKNEDFAKHIRGK